MNTGLNLLLSKAKYVCLALLRVSLAHSKLWAHIHKLALNSVEL